MEEEKLFTSKYGVVVFILDVIYFWGMVMFNIEEALEAQTTSIIALGSFLILAMTAPIHIALLVLNIISLKKKNFMPVEIVGYVGFGVILVTSIAMIFIL